MSKFMKELMLDQLRNDLGEARSLLILDLKGLDAITETRLRADLRKKQIKLKAIKNTLAGVLFEELGMGGLKKFLAGPSVAVWGGAGVAELAKEISAQVKKLKKPAIKGGAVDGVVIGPDQVEDITKLPSREELIGRVAAIAISPAQRVVSLANAPASGLLGQLRAIADKDGSADDQAAPADDAPAEAAG